MNEYILFICCLYYLSVHFHSYSFYIQYRGGIREITSLPPCQYKYCALCSILLTRWRSIRFFYHVRAYETKKDPIWACPPPLPLPVSPLFVATTLNGDVEGNVTPTLFNFTMSTGGYRYTWRCIQQQNYQLVVVKSSIKDSYKMLFCVNPCDMVTYIELVYFYSRF